MLNICQELHLLLSFYLIQVRPKQINVQPTRLLSFCFYSNNNKINFVQLFDLQSALEDLEKILNL